MFSKVNNEDKLKVAMIGDLCLDVFFQIPEYPHKGGDGLATQFVRQSGGSVANTAIALSHFGFEPYLFTHTGKDTWSYEVMKILEKENVHLDYVTLEEAETIGVTFLAVTPDGERTMFTYRGANSLLQPREITSEIMAGFSILHLSGYACLTSPQSDAVMKAVEIASQKNIAISLDIGVEPAHKMGEALIHVLPDLSLLILGEPEICAICCTSSIPDAEKFLIDHGVKVIALKLGKNGCRLTTREQQVTVPSFQVDVVDTTGAGDAFGAAMIYGLSQQWGLHITGLLANAMGGLTTTRWGAGAMMPDKAEIIQFLHSREHQSGENKTVIQELIEKINSPSLVDKK